MSLVPVAACKGLAFGCSASSEPLLAWMGWQMVQSTWPMPQNVAVDDIGSARRDFGGSRRSPPI
jgi:hypothetical protein